MAITIQQTPNVFAPVYNPMVFVITSTNATQANFKAFADVYIDGVTSPAFRRYAKPSDPNVASIAFDISKALEKEITYDLSQTTYGFQRNTSSFKRYSVYFGEQFGPSSGVTVTSGVTSSLNRYAYNAVFDYPDFAAYTQADYILDNVSKPFLTNIPTSGTVRESQDAWVYLITSGATTVDYMEIRTFGSSDAAIQTVRVNNSFKNLTADGDRFLRFSAGPRNLNLISASDITLGAQDIITSSVYWYTLQAFNSSGARTSKAYRYDIKRDCVQHTVFQFFWLNKLGGFDQFSFIRLSRLNTEIKRQSYKKVYGTQTLSGWSYNQYDRGKSNYDIRTNDKVTVHSDWVNDDTATWLKELFTSPEVYIADGTTRLAVNITDTSFEEKKIANDKVINYTVTFEYSFDNYRQRQ